MQLRPWQAEAVRKALSWLVESRSDKHFLINAAPGSGKTIASCVIARELVRMNEIDRIIVIAPRREVIKQWSEDFRAVTGRYMSRIAGSDAGIVDQLDVCATWAAVEGLSDAFRDVCRNHRTLVICDEHHHAAVSAAWGENADSAFAEAAYVLVLTGTPIRSDGEQSVWLAYDANGRIEHPPEGTYTLTYGEAVNLGYCRPVTFHRHEGKFTVDLQDGTSVQVSGQNPTVNAHLLRVPALQRALNFYKLACTPQYQGAGDQPKIDGYQATMFEWADEKLTELRERLPNAGGLVIAPSIQMAEYFERLIESIDGDKPSIVHSNSSNNEMKIDAFRNTDKKWIVSVAMISEGVDIKRLRVLIYLPNALTELAFRQAIGRVVRSAGPDDDTRAYVVMPSFIALEEFARRVEEEMPAWSRNTTQNDKKRCPICQSECQRDAKVCDQCGHEFPERRSHTKQCPQCGAGNPPGSETCRTCGASMGVQFSLTLDEALRAGVIVRGLDIDETEVQEAEAMAPDLRRRILDSGDASLIRLINSVPPSKR